MFNKIFGTKKYITEQLKVIQELKISNDKKEEMIVTLFEEYTSFKIAQRLMALIIIITYLFAIILSLVYQHYGISIKELITIATAFNVGLVMLAVTSFYFGGGTIAAIRGK